MKRLDIRITDRLDAALGTLKTDTERSKTEVVHDAVALLDWARVVYGRGNVIGEINPDSGTVATVFAMPMFVGEVPSRPDEQSQNREPAVKHDIWTSVFREACTKEALPEELANKLMTVIRQALDGVELNVEEESFDLVHGARVSHVGVHRRKRKDGARVSHVGVHTGLDVPNIVRRKRKDKVT